MSGNAGSSPGNKSNENSYGMDTLLDQLRQQNRPISLDPIQRYYSNEQDSFYGQIPTQPQPQKQPPRDLLPQISPTSSFGNSSHRNSTSNNFADVSKLRINGGAINSDRTSSLLNLLKFSTPPSSISNLQPSAPISQPLPVSREVSSKFPGIDGSIQSGNTQKQGDINLFSAFLNTSSPKLTQQPNPTAISALPTFAPDSVSPSADTQAYLLQLLNQPKSSLQPEKDNVPLLKQENQPSTPRDELSNHGNSADELAQDVGESTLNIGIIGGTDKTSTRKANKGTLKSISTSKNAPGIFTYVNPFDGLAESSPRNRPQKSEKSNAPLNSTFQILKNPRNEISEKQKSASDSSAPSNMEQKLEAAPEKNIEIKSSLTLPLKQKETSENEDDSKRKDLAQKDSGEEPKLLDSFVSICTPNIDKVDEKLQIESKLREMIALKNEKDSETIVKNDSQHETKKFELDTNNSNQKSSEDDIEITNKVKNSDLNHVIDSWESVDTEESPSKDEEEITIKVYNFPMRPWTSITIRETDVIRPFFREKSILDIARLKREFDQVDRTLVTASANFIVYGMSKNGGVRIIRQEDGKDAKLFTETHDRIFNVTISTSSIEKKQAVIGTGVSGTIYWVQLKDGEGDRLEDSHLESFGFALPPIQDPDPDALMTALKTRARKSSNHPDFFAVGRGKFIYIVFPSVILEKYILNDGNDRQVDVTNYASHDSLKINSGKSVKDFTFSEDDTTIASLDKSGRIKFWDIRGLIKRDANLTSLDMHQTEVKDPIVIFNNIPATEKSSPTSIIFVDKIRPYQRGGALRYLIVGMMQNHTLQLWDISLGKPVQEINLPHTSDSDAICSVVYHASTGMIVIGHPTRNSIYFLHLSVPKYFLPKSISQAEYLEMLTLGGTTFPKTESTAVVSGMREYSFANKGTLRSLDILSPDSKNPSDKEALFELYCVHSKGVTCLEIRMADLGWNSENRVVNPVVAQNLNLISINTLREAPILLQPESNEATSQPVISTRIVPRTSGNGKAIENIKDKAVAKVIFEEPTKPILQKTEDKIDKKENSTPNSNLITPNAPEKLEKKKRRKGPYDNNGSSQNNAYFKMPVIDPSSNVRNIESIRINPNPVSEFVTQSSVSELDLKSVEKLFTSSLDKLHQDLKVEQQVQNANVNANHESILRTVTETLNDTIETSLAKIVRTSIDSKVLPVISDVTSRSIQDQLCLKFDNQLTHQLPQELQRILPDAVSKALYQPQILKLISDSLATTVALDIQKELNLIMASSVMPGLSNLISQSMHKISIDIQSRSTDQINIIEQQYHSNSMKIAQLTQLVTGLSETVSSMAAAQTEFQGQFLKMQSHAAKNKFNVSRPSESHSNHPNSRPSTAFTGSVERIRVDEEYDNMLKRISISMNTGQYENAVIQWLQTRREQEFFVNYFSKYSPEFIRELSPLLLLSLGATITVAFEGDFNHDLIIQRIAWLETILATFQANITAGSIDDQVRELSPKIMGIYRQRLEHLFMRISQISSHEPILKRISVLVTAANRIIDTARVDERIHEYVGELAGGTPMGIPRHGL
ncbi:putative wd40 repeat-like protein [Erysiphe neolycopersici]|uniref:Putative wd40 repeat-like protein n=1 Tax=Erysiphe neolycopersici TaxID=212602 RepID=A0A420I6T8_9PEZI|nr:putative wd40 repeat-like protein [Erysiphe neolycopersici]